VIGDSLVRCRNEWRQGSGSLPNKRDVFVFVFGFMVCSPRSRAARVAARIHLFECRIYFVVVDMDLAENG
jgi:hypothetical protein